MNASFFFFKTALHVLALFYVHIHLKSAQAEEEEGYEFETTLDYSETLILINNRYSNNKLILVVLSPPM